MNHIISPSTIFGPKKIRFQFENLQNFYNILNFLKNNDDRHKDYRRNEMKKKIIKTTSKHSRKLSERIRIRTTFLQCCATNRIQIVFVQNIFFCIHTNDVIITLW